MSRIRGRDTRPEVTVRVALRRAGVRYRSYRRIGGVRVDFALPDLRIALFVHGCFWHGCPRHYSAPKSNASFWKTKLSSNRLRDLRQARLVRSAGWSPVVIWEHSLRADPTVAVRKALRKVQGS